MCSKSVSWTDSISNKPVHLLHIISQEKKKLQEKELDDLDDLLGEFGITTTEANEAVEEKKVEDEPLAASTADASKKKKKKSKKKTKSSTEADDWVQVDAPESEATVVDVAAVLKAKAKTKEKSAAEIAAATAAKEAKAKADKKAAEEKKKVWVFWCIVKALHYVWSCWQLNIHFFCDRKRRRTRRNMLALEGDMGK